MDIYDWNILKIFIIYLSLSLISNNRCRAMGLQFDRLGYLTIGKLRNQERFNSKICNFFLNIKFKDILICNLIYNNNNNE